MGISQKKQECPGKIRTHGEAQNKKPAVAGFLSRLPD
jgi:hypothetical protein